MLLGNCEGDYSAGGKTYKNSRQIMSVSLKLMSQLVHVNKVCNVVLTGNFKSYIQLISCSVKIHVFISKKYFYCFNFICVYLFHVINVFTLSMEMDTTICHISMCNCQLSWK